MLVSRLPDRRELARLVRAALRHEVAAVHLAAGPLRAEAHALDLHVVGSPPLALLAEPAGAPENGHFPLRLRPLYRGQAAQLYALLQAENVPMEQLAATVELTPLPDAGPISSSKGDAAPIARAMVGAPPPPVPTPPAPGDGPDAEDISLELTVDFDDEDRADTDVPASPADQEEPSLSVSVVFEPDLIAPAIREAAAKLIAEEQAAADQITAELPQLPPLSDPTSSEGFFDEALASLPHTALPSELPPDPGSSDPLLQSDEVRDLVAEAIGAAEASPAPVVPASPPSRPRPPRFDDDAEATLVRFPIPPRPSESPQGMVVLAAARHPEELTPTQRNMPPGRKKKSTRRKAKTSEAPPSNKKRPSDLGAKPRASARPPPPAPAPEPPSAPRDPAIGRRIADGKYVIESLIGSGAAGAVYRATHRELRRTVAIKLLHPHYQQDPHFMTSFRAEALAASQLDHPNVMRVLDFGQEPDGLFYIVMEHLSGRTLQSLLDEERRLATERAVEIMIQVCAALSVAHDHGIIHRDIKPDNIMLVPSRNDEGAAFELVKVCDFGIAALQNPRAEDADVAEANDHIIAGTPEYMSPEQARGGEIDARSDVYSCGICLYELVTGRPPFLGDHAGEILIKQVEELPKPPSALIKGLDPIIEEIILRAIQKDPQMRHQSAREMRVELKELIEPGEGYDKDQDELSIVENVPVLDDPASGFPGFFIAFSSAVLRFGRFERGHHEAAQAMKELQKAIRLALRGRSEITFARRDVQKTIAFVVMSGTAEIVDLRRLLGSQLMGSFGEPFLEAMVKKGIVALTLREGMPDTELQYIVEMLMASAPFAHEELRKELLTKPLRHVSVLFAADVVGRDRKLAWKVGLCATRLARDLRALCNVRGISLKKMRETRDELIGGVARLLTRGDEVRQFLLNADVVDDAVANLRGFSSFHVAPIIVERVLHESAAETAMLLLADLDADEIDREVIGGLLRLFAARLVTERSVKSDAAVAELYRRKIVAEAEMPRDLKESIRAQTLADALVREPSQFLLTLDLIGDPEAYARELATLEAAMATLARRSEAVALLAVMSTLARHAKGAGKPGMRENAALRTMKSMIDKERLLPIAMALLTGPAHQREAARQLVVIAGSVGAAALYAAREATTDPSARPIFVRVFRDTGPAGWTLLSQILPRLEVRDDAELALVEDLLRAMPDRADPILGETVAKFLTHPLLRPTALAVIVPLWGERAKKPLVEALEYAEEPTRIIALTELRRLRAIDEYVFAVIERFLTMRGSAGEELRAAAAAALVDVPAPLRTRAIQLLSKSVEGKRGFVAMLRGDGGSDESLVVLEAMGRALLTLDRAEGARALKSRLSRSDGALRTRLAALLQLA